MNRLKEFTPVCSCGREMKHVGGMRPPGALASDYFECPGQHTDRDGHPYHPATAVYREAYGASGPIGKEELAASR